MRQLLPSGRKILWGPLARLNALPVMEKLLSRGFPPCCAFFQSFCWVLARSTISPQRAKWPVRSLAGFLAWLLGMRLVRHCMVAMCHLLSGSSNKRVESDSLSRRSRRLAFKFTVPGGKSNEKELGFVFRFACHSRCIDRLCKTERNGQHRATGQSSGYLTLQMQL